MSFELERINRIIKDLKKYITKQSFAITHYKVQEGNAKNLEKVALDDSSWQNYTTGDLWGGYDKHMWFRTSFSIPKDFKDKHVTFNINTGHQEGWDISNPQFLCYVNGNLVQGLDVNHRSIILSQKAVADEVYHVAILGYSGLNQERVYLKTELAAIDEEIKDFYYNINNLFWSACILDEDDTNRLKLMTDLNKTVDTLDLRKIYSDDFYISLRKANMYLKEIYYSTINENTPIVTTIGHTHIDIAWLWTVSQTREKVVRSFSTVLYLMDHYPEYKFMSSQPQLYAFLKEEAPDLYKKVKEKVKEGRWEVDGAMWLEADCNIPSGESLVRQLLFGARFFKEEFGVTSKTLWLPDVFGYSAALPQLLKKSGINYFFTTKLDWNQFNKMPHDTFMWRGIDGSEVFTQLATTTGHVLFDNEVIKRENPDRQTTYNGRVNPNQVLGNWTRYQDKTLTNETLQLFGFGDGGGGPTEEMLENAKRLKYGLPGIPRVNMDFQSHYFDRVYEQAKDKPELAKWVGELYFECHRGTYTSMAKNKRYNRKLEFLYHDIESLYSLNQLTGGSYPQDAINAAWKTILLNQFHDIIPGSAIEKVYDQTDKEYEALLKDGNKLLKNAVEGIATKIDLSAHSLVIFNTLSYSRNDLVEVTLPKRLTLYGLKDSKGNILPVQHVEEGHKFIFFARDIPSRGYKTYELLTKGSFVENQDSPCSTFTEDYLLQTPFYTVTFDKNYAITSLWDKKAHREVIEPGKKGNAFQIFEDRPMDFENWDIDVYYKQKMYEVEGVSDVQLVENGPLRTCLQVTRTYYDSTIIQKMYFYNDLERIDFKTEIDWHEKHVLLKVAFPVDVHTDKASFEIQYGNVERPTHDNTSWDVARFEVCAHKWVDLSEMGYGVSLLNDCKYGHDIKDNCMRLTLIKCGEYPNANADIGHHTFTYSLYPHQGTWREASTQKEAYNLNAPMHSILEEAHTGTLPKDFSMFGANEENCMIEVVKKHEDSQGFIVRIFEYMNKRTPLTLSASKEIAEVYECDLLENKLAKIAHTGEYFTVQMMPYEIKTYLITLK